MKKAGGLCLLLLLTTVTILYLFRLPVATFLLTDLLKKTGTKDVHLTVSRISSNKLTVSRISCTLPETGTHVAAQHVSLSWDRTALTTRKLQLITIESLTLDLPAESKKHSKTQFNLASFPHQIKRFTGLFPFQKLAIQRLIINSGVAGSFSGQEFTLTLTNKQGGNELQGELALPKHDLRLKITTRDSAQWVVRLDTPKRAQTILTALIKLKDDRIQATTSADLAQFSLLPPLFVPDLPELSGRLKLSGSIPFSSKPSVQLKLILQQLAIGTVHAQEIQLSMQGSMETPSKFLLADTASLSISKLQQGTTSLTRLTMGLGGQITKHDNQWQFAPAPRSTILLSELKNTGQSIQSIAITPSMDTIVSGQIITISLAPQWQVQATAIGAGSLNIADVSLRPEQQTTIRIQADDGYSWTVSPSDWKLIPDKAQLNELTLSPDSVKIYLKKLTGKGAHWQTDLSLTCPKLGLTMPDNGLTILDISSELNMHENGIQGTATFRPDSVPGSLTGTFSYNPKNGAGTFTLSTNEALKFSQTTPLSSLITTWPLSADLNEGTLQLQGYGQWGKNQPLSFSLQTELSKGRGLYKNLLFSGLNTRQNLQLLPTLQSNEPGFISVQEVDTGLVIHNISTTTRLRPSPHGPIPQIELNDMSASIFGGTVTDKHLLVDPQQIKVKNTITLHNINLAKLITVQNVKGLEISGRIDGIIPYRFDDSGLQVSKGILQNTPGGGVIRYSLPKGPGLKDSPLTAYALKALEEFHYDHLSATAKYSPDGELRVGLHLEGKSPKLKTSRPVHLNITTEQNVLSLLQSLRYSRTLTDEIDTNLQHHSW